MDGSINEHSTRETSERTLKTEQERIKHNVNLSLKEKRAKQTKVKKECKIRKSAKERPIREIIEN